MASLTVDGLEAALKERESRVAELEAQLAAQSTRLAELELDGGAAGGAASGAGAAGGDAPESKSADDSGFTPEEYAGYAKLMASEPPKVKGKPGPEQIAALTAFKAAKKEFLDGIRARLGDDKLADKKLLKDLSSGAAAAEEAARKAFLEPPSGTRDFFPDAMRERNWLFDHFRKVGRSFGFQEYDAPVLEHTRLYERKAGEEITEQMYNFIDKERNHVTLRPEMTPTLARMVLQRQNAATGEIKDLLPFKWFSIPQCWRFESTQRGRKREHYQWNMDIVGVPGVEAELELLGAVSSFFTNLGIGSDIVGIKVNSRRVLGSLLEKYGVTKEAFAPVCVVIDKLDKIGPEAVTELLGEKGVSAETAAEMLRALEAKTIDELAEVCAPLNKELEASIDELRNLFVLAEAYGFADYLIFDAAVVRGLAYYTGVVFECFDRRGTLRAICGGGRYDGLLELYGSKVRVPCCGFGFGDCVIVELLKDLNKKPAEQCPRQVDFVVAAFNKDMFGPACEVAAGLRKGGATVDLLQTPKKKVKQAFEYADRAGAE